MTHASSIWCTWVWTRSRGKAPLLPHPDFGPGALHHPLGCDRDGSLPPWISSSRNLVPKTHYEPEAFPVQGPVVLSRHHNTNSLRFSGRLLILRIMRVGLRQWEISCEVALLSYARRQCSIIRVQGFGRWSGPSLRNSQRVNLGVKFFVSCAINRMSNCLHRY